MKELYGAKCRMKGYWASVSSMSAPLSQQLTVITDPEPLCTLSFRTFHGCSIQFSSVAQSCPTLGDPMNRSMPGLPVHHQPPKFTQTPVHRVGGAIQPVIPSSHLILYCPLLLLPPIPPSIRVFSMSQLFTWDDRSTGVSVSASVLPMNTQDWSPLGWTGWISLQSKELSRVFSNTTVQKHQFFGAQLSSRGSNWSNHWSLLINKSTALLCSQPSNHIFVFLLTTSWFCLGMSHCFRVLTKSLFTPTSMPKTFRQFWFLLQRLGFLMHPTWAGDLFHPR